MSSEFRIYRIKTDFQPNSYGDESLSKYFSRVVIDSKFNNLYTIGMQMQ